MVGRLVMLIVLAGISTFSNSASVLNFELLGSPPKKDKTKDLSGFSEKYENLRERNSLLALTKNQTLPSKQSNPDIDKLINRANTSDFLNRHRESEFGFFDGENQEASDESKIAWKEIKTSLKEFNTEWNKAENSVNEFLLEDVGLSNLNKVLASHGIDLLSDAGEDNDYAQTQYLNSQNYRDRLPEVDPPLLDQPLYRFDLLGLLNLITDNVGKIFLLIALSFFIKGIVIFIKWKSEKRSNRRKHKKSRSIDGFTKF